MAFVFFLLGLIAGSFANVIILRENTGVGITFSRSRCFHCGQKLSWSELIPVLSFILQRGRCRNCGSKISWQYPLVELAMGLLFLGLFLKLRTDWSPLLLWLFAGFFIVILAVYDWRHKILPDKFIYLFIVTGVLSIFKNFNIWSLWPALFLFLLYLVSRGRWMGLGDAKFMLGAGLLLSWPLALYALAISFWVGALVGLALLFLTKSYSLKSELPFGPFLALGTLVALFLIK